MEGTVKVAPKDVERGAMDINIVGHAIRCQLSDFVLTIGGACTHKEWTTAFVMKYMFKEFDDGIAELIAMQHQEYLEHNVTFSYRRIDR